MLNSRHSEAILSPSLSRITKRMRSSITEHFLHGMFNPALGQGKSVTHVSGTFCYLCLGTVKSSLQANRTHECVHSCSNSVNQAWSHKRRGVTSPTVKRRTDGAVRLRQFSPPESSGRPRFYPAPGNV